MRRVISFVVKISVSCAGVLPAVAAEPVAWSRLASEVTLPLGNDNRIKRHLTAWDESRLPAPVVGRDAADEGDVANVKRTVRLPISSGFGVRFHPILKAYREHKGIDIPGPRGALIRATESGVVSHAGWAGGYGNLVEVDHGNGLTSRYGHLDRITAAAGSRIERGDTIGLMGSTGQSTGTHLHFEIRSGGVAIDPLRYLSTGVSIVTAAPATDPAATISKFARARATPLMLTAP